VAVGRGATTTPQRLDALPAGPARDAPLSGLAVGPHRVYLTVAGQPYLISVAKPPL